MVTQRDTGIEDLVPRPDPTVLTTQQLVREIAMLKELLFARMDAMDRIIALMQEQLDRRQLEVREEVQHLRELHQSKLDGIQERFNERDRVQVAAVSKSDAATAKQLDSITAVLGSDNKAMSEKVDDVKDRLTALEGVQRENYGRSRAFGEGWGYIVGAIGALVGIATLIAFLVDRVLT